MIPSQSNPRSRVDRTAVRAVLVSFVLAASAVLAGHAAAYEYGSVVGYDSETVTVNGYSRTRKQNGDWNWIRICIFVDIDLDYGPYCAVYHSRYFFPSVHGEFGRQTPGTPRYSSYKRDYVSAITYHAVANPAGDTWIAAGRHYVEADHYFTYCSIIGGVLVCGPQIYAGTVKHPLGASQASNRVCGTPTVYEMVREYIPPLYIGITTPTCEDFANGGGSEHFTWSQLNGGFQDGNPHRPWGIVRQSLKYGLDYVARNYENFAGIYLTSGYRCPHGNADAGGVNTSYHMHGMAGDLLRPGWTEEEFIEVKKKAEEAGGFGILPYSWYTDHHLHVVF